jgi:dihydroneopterin aldolase
MFEQPIFSESCVRRIILNKLRVQASVGILPHELTAKQPLLISCEVRMQNAPLVPAQDEVSHVLDYRRIRQIAIDQAQNSHINMLESLAGQICEKILVLPGVSAAMVRIDKPNIFPDCDGVGVEVTAEKV